MKREIFKNPDLGPGEILKYFLLAAAIVAGALFCVCHSSCQLTSQGIQALGAEDSPKIVGVSVLNSKSVKIDFSKEVNGQTGLVSKLQEGQKASLDVIAQNPIQAKANSFGDGKSLLYIFDQSARLGERYQLFSQISDKRGNTLTFAIPFDGFNESVPLCKMIEVQAESRSAKNESDESPYVIIQALQDGNLFGIDLYCAQNKAVYQLPAVEVKAGDKIVLHLKHTAFPDACVSELESDLNLAKSGRAKAIWRDIYFDIGPKGISASNDALFLRNRNTGKLMDALTYYTVKNGKTTWNLGTEIQKAIDKGAWSGLASVEDAVQKTGSKVKPLVRAKAPKADGPACKEDWTSSKESVY